MWGVGLPELAVIMLVAVLVFGPDRLPDFARQAGRFLRQVKVMANQARDDLREELGPEYADLELRDLDPRTIVRKHIIEAMNEPDETDGASGVKAVNGTGAEEKRPGVRPLLVGEVPPYDVDAT